MHKIFLITLAVMAFEANAQEFSGKKTTPLQDNLLTSFSAPTLFIESWEKCEDHEKGRKYNPYACSDVFGMASASATTYIPLSLLLAHANREDIKNLEGDAYLYLAGEPLSESLEEMIRNLQNEIQGLEEVSDEDMVLLLLKISA